MSWPALQTWQLMFPQRLVPTITYSASGLVGETTERVIIIPFMLSRNAKGNASYILEETRGSFASRPPIQPKIRAIVLFRNGRLSTPKLPRGVRIGKHQ